MERLPLPAALYFSQHGAIFPYSPVTVLAGSAVTNYNEVWQMNRKMRMVLLLLVSFTLYSPLAAIADKYDPDTRQSEDKLEYTKGESKAATTARPMPPAAQPPETSKKAPKAKPKKTP
jgi:hypothetical protein